MEHKLPGASPSGTRCRSALSTVEAEGAERIERRAVWALALATIVLVFPSFGLSFLGGPEAWNVALFVAAQAALVLSVGASGLALVPRPGYVPGALRRRDPLGLLFWAYALLSGSDFS